METGIAKLTPELLALLSSSDSNAIAPYTREIFLLEIVVAGTSYCKEIDDLESELVPSTVLKMIRDPKNKYDEFAIGIYLNNTRVGWVPMQLNLVVSRLMDAGKAFFCRIVGTNKINDWLRIEANIYMVE